MCPHTTIDVSSYCSRRRCVLILQTALVVWRCSSLDDMLHQQRHTRLEQRVCVVFVCVCVWCVYAVLHLSEFSDQLDVTLESSKIVKLALIWVARTQSDAIK
jgi:hypothetical protein